MEYLPDFEYLTDLADRFLAYLNRQPPGWIYFFLFVGAFMENVVPPIPGDTLIVFGAYLSGIGIISVAPAYLAMWVGSALGCLFVYTVAWWVGRPFFLKFVSDENLSKAEDWFARHGQKIVVFNRFLPTVRVFVGIVAGLIHMNPVRMVVYVFIGTFLWNSLLVYFGVMVGENWRMVIQVLHTYNRVLLALVVVAGVGYWLWKRRETEKLNHEEQEEHEERQKRGVME